MAVREPSGPKTLLDYVGQILIWFTFLGIGFLVVKGCMSEKKEIKTNVSRLSNENPSVRRLGAEQLGIMGKRAKYTVRHLIEALEDENELVREAAANSLRKIGPDAKAALPVLTAALKDQAINVRTQAAEAIKKITKRE